MNLWSQNLPALCGRGEISQEGKEFVAALFLSIAEREFAGIRSGIFLRLVGLRFGSTGIAEIDPRGSARKGRCRFFSALFSRGDSARGRELDRGKVAWTRKRSEGKVGVEFAASPCFILPHFEAFLLL
jgi:hypothetical protein